MTLCQINQDKIKILRGPVSSVSSDTVSKILPNPAFKGQILLSHLWANIRFRHGRPLTAETRVKYFSQLTDEELTQLHEIYRPDFELFEYKFDLTSYRRWYTQFAIPSMGVWKLELRKPNHVRQDNPVWMRDYYFYMMWIKHLYQRLCHHNGTKLRVVIITKASGPGLWVYPRGTSSRGRWRSSRRGGSPSRRPCTGPSHPMRAVRRDPFRPSKKWKKDMLLDLHSSIIENSNVNVTFEYDQTSSF